jgi:tetratricopeptide (TPR) repeat protein
VKTPQWITIAVALLLTTGIYFFVRTVPSKKEGVAVQGIQHSVGDSHNHDEAQATITIDSILVLAKKKLTPQQVVRINTLENSITRGNVKGQQLAVYHQLAHFWGDSAAIFEPYAWYEAESARLENSEKSLTFAARLFLDNLQEDDNGDRRRWKALQAKDLFERSLMINPANDSAKVGLGACYLFGNISAAPMEGIAKIREVVAKDSGNVYAQLMLVKGSVISGQYEKAIPRLQTVNRLQPENVEAILMLADVYERMGEKANAVIWYQKSLEYIKRPDARKEIGKRMEELRN